MTAYTLNNKLKGIEISFDSIPDNETRFTLKKHGFRWNPLRRIWYARYSDDLPFLLDVAQKLTGGGNLTRLEGKQKEKEVDLTVEHMNSLKSEYFFEATGSGLYAGWTGNNHSKISTLSTADTKKVILEKLKNCGINATAKVRHSGYTPYFTFTIKTPKEYALSEDEYIAEELKKSFSCRCWYYKPDGTEIHINALLELPQKEINIIREETARREYQTALSSNKSCIVRPEFVSLVKTIVESFNSNHSNSMIDYFDVGFYANYKYKIQ